MNGIVNLYKEKGISSFQAVKQIRKIFGVKKCGHMGTLDPLAEGVLPISLGYATKFADYLMAVNKEYVARFTLGQSTDSFDTEGTVRSENKDIVPAKDEIEAALERFSGAVELVVPAFSAKKINGERAYKLARKGEIEDAGSRVMVIFETHLLDYEYPEGVIRVSCGKGTYIRSIIHEMGQDLGCGAVMNGLIRTVNGCFSSKNSVTLKELEEMKEAGRLEDAVVPVWEAIDWPAAVVREDSEGLILNGVSVKPNNYLNVPDSESKMYFIKGEDGRLLAFAEKTAASPVPLKIVKVVGG